MSQTYADLQIVLINDGSTDDSWSIMQDIAGTDSRIEIYSRENRGVAATRNELLSKANGDFVLFVDSDDWIENNMVEVLIREQQKQSVDIVASRINLHEIDGVFSREEIVEMFLVHKVFNGSLWNKLIRRDLFNGLTFNAAISYGEDALMIWSIIQKVDQVAIISQHLYHVEPNPQSLSRKKLDKKKFSVYNVWNGICADVDAAWPQFSDIGHARFACEMTLILRDAIKMGYQRDEYVKTLQEEIRRDVHLIPRTGISTWAMYAFAWLVSHNYWLASHISHIVW